MKLFKYKSVEFLEDIIVSKRLYCSRYDCLNDPMEWAFTSNPYRDEIQNLLEKTAKESWRICCLSKSEQYGLMWSMYGDNHKGVCIELEIEEGRFQKFDTPGDDCGLFWGEIKYADKVPDYLECRADLKRVLWIKSQQWKHEQEVRFVKRLNAEEKNAYLQIDKINCIYLGKRMAAETKVYVQKLCADFNVTWKEMTDDDAPQINFWNDENNNPFAENI